MSVPPILKDLNIAPSSNGGVLSKIVTPFEEFYGTVGAIYPSQRFIVGSLLGAAAMFVLEPSFAFDEQGPKPFQLFASGGDQSRATYFHWAVPALAFGAASALFV